MIGRFESELRVREVDGGRDAWELLCDLVYVDEDGTKYVARRGTVTDFASIPRGLWNIFPKYGKHNRAAVIHDDLCTRKPVDSAKAHAVFRNALRACGVNKFSRNVM